jgi:hypothetical protein
VAHDHNWARLPAGKYQDLGISESTSSTARDARERFHSCRQGNAGELEWGALAGILFSSCTQPFGKLFNVQP